MSRFAAPLRLASTLLLLTASTSMARADEPPPVTLPSPAAAPDLQEAPPPTTSSSTNEPKRRSFFDSFRVHSTGDTDYGRIAPTHRTLDSEYGELRPHDQRMAFFIGKPTQDELKNGYVRLHARFTLLMNYDFKPAGNVDDFVPSSFPFTANPDTPNVNFNMRPTRLILEGGKETSLGMLSALLTSDFYGRGANSTPNVRIFEAYVRLGWFRTGRAWTTFMDVDAVPNTLEFWGPVGALFSRREMLRFEPSFGLWRFQLAAENPLVDVGLSNKETQKTIQPMPDFTGAVQFGDQTHLRAAGVARSIGYQDTLTGAHHQAFGWGSMLSGLLSLKNGSRASAHINYGKGYASYTDDLSNGQGYDGYVAANGSVKPVKTLGWWVALEPQWTSYLRSTFVYSQVDAFLFDEQPNNAQKRGRYIAANFVVKPMSVFDVGAEFLYGQNVRKDKSEYHTERIIVSTRFFY